MYDVEMQKGVSLLPGNSSPDPQYVRGSPDAGPGGRMEASGDRSGIDKSRVKSGVKAKGKAFLDDW